MITETLLQCLLVGEVNCAHGTRRYRLAQFIFSISTGAAFTLASVFSRLCHKQQLDQKSRFDAQTYFISLGYVYMQSFCFCIVLLV